MDSEGSSWSKARERLAKSVLNNSLSHLHHLHSRGFVHRDVKLDNFMVSDQSLYLLDLGIAAPSHSTGENACLDGGTLEYVPPGHLLDSDAKISPAQDW